MQLKILHDCGEISTYDISRNSMLDQRIENKTGFIGVKSKEKTALDIIRTYYSKGKGILYDHSNTLIEKRLHHLNIESIDKMSIHPLFDDQDFSLMFFTSGTTGESVGALKSRENLEEEVKVLSKLLEKYAIKKVIVTVPFVHIYGMLVGLLYPLLNGIDIVLKEHFLPNDLINVIEDNSLIVTTPLYIKALNKVSKTANLSNSIFISSTAPLDTDSAKSFCEKFNTNVIQLFGSTETGGIAYKYNDDTLWTPMENVQISTNDENELKVQSPYISNVLFSDKFSQTNQSIQTFDYVKIVGNQFQLIGRSSQILKISGKRYSTIQIEEVLEGAPSIEKAIAYVKKSENVLKDEILDITIQSQQSFSKKEIKQLLQTHLSNLKFEIDLTIVDKIEVSNVGKKRRVL